MRQSRGRVLSSSRSMGMGCGSLRMGGLCDMYRWYRWCIEASESSRDEKKGADDTYYIGITKYED